MENFKKSAIITSILGFISSLIFLLSLSSTQFGGPAYLYPDKNLTQGEIDKTLTAEYLCTHSTKERRNVSQATKCEVFKRYGLSCEQPRGKYEIDHFCPLGLGCTNSIKNLWPEKAPEFHLKDKVEAYLHNQVCKNNIELKEAQKMILKDWYKVYKEEIEDKLGSIEGYIEDEEGNP